MNSGLTAFLWMVIVVVFSFSLVLLSGPKLREWLQVLLRIDWVPRLTGAGRVAEDSSRSLEPRAYGLVGLCPRCGAPGAPYFGSFSYGQPVYTSGSVGSRERWMQRECQICAGTWLEIMDRVPAYRWPDEAEPLVPVEGSDQAQICQLRASWESASVADRQRVLGLLGKVDADLRRRLVDDLGLPPVELDVMAEFDSRRAALEPVGESTEVAVKCVCRADVFSKQGTRGLRRALARHVASETHRANMRRMLRDDAGRELAVWKLLSRS